MRGFNQKREALSSLALIFLLIAVIETAWLKVLTPLDYQATDLLLQYRAQQQSPDPDIVIIDIDEHSIVTLAPELGRYPWPRSVHAELIEGISAQKPQAILFDILFTDPDIQQYKGDQYLIEIAQNTPNLFFPFQRLKGGQDANGLSLDQYGKALGFRKTEEAKENVHAALLLPMAQLALTGRIGTINFHEDSDGIGRRYDLYLDIDGWKLPSLPAKVADYLGMSLPSEQNIQLNWKGGPLSYQRISYADLFIDMGRQKQLRNPHELANKIIIIGSTAPSLHDLRTTPVGSLMPAVEIVATAIDNLKNGDHLIATPWKYQLLFTLALLFLLYTVLRILKNPMIIGLLLVTASAAVIITAYQLLTQQLVLPIVTPLFLPWLYFAAYIGLSYRYEKRERLHSVEVFSRFLDRRIVNELVKSDQPLPEGRGESMPVTVLFSDIRNFTTLSEQHPPEYIVSLLNQYFSRQVAVIFRNGGTMDKFIGDAVMAFWGAPVEDENQSIHAVAAALEMEQALLDFHSEMEDNAKHFEIGIGIHSGNAVVGFIGADNRLDYTAIGDTVNLASRIEGKTKGVARILVSETTREQCGDHFDFIDMGIFEVKGRTQPVRLFQPKAPKLKS